MSTAKVLIKGRNFLLLLERLTKADVKLLNINRISSTETIITVKYKDLKKVFAISKNLWYNTLLELNGFIGFLSRLKKNALKIVLVIAFIVASLLSDGLVFGIKIDGIKGDKLYNAYVVLRENGVRLNGINLGYDEKSIKSELFKSVDGASFVTVKKSGNRLVIGIFCRKEGEKVVRFSDSVYAKRSGKLLKIDAYFGTSLKSAGDAVISGEKLADGYYVDKSGNKIKSECYSSYAIECVFIKEYFIRVCDTTDKDALIARALFDGNIDDKDLLSAKIEPVKETDEGVYYTVTVSYLFKEE